MSCFMWHDFHAPGTVSTSDSVHNFGLLTPGTRESRAGRLETRRSAVDSALNVAS